MSWAALAMRSGLSPTNRAPHGFCCSSKPSTSRPMASEVGVEVLVADVLLVDALVMERFGLVLVMTGLLKSRRGPVGPLAAELMVRGRVAEANPVVLGVSLKFYPHHTKDKRPIRRL